MLNLNALIARHLMAHAPPAFLTSLALMLALCPAVSHGQNSSLGNSLSGETAPQPLPVARAFPYYVSVEENERLSVTWQIASGHYLYRGQFSFALQRGPEGDVLPLDATIPVGVASNDEFFGDIEIYYDTVTIGLPLPVPLPALASGTSLLISYQGCAVWGYCYPPQQVSYLLNP
ncbi:MAG: protein-disulfide reductase DsbD N-terminal domain-containing protein [Pseudohongiellaceae bacterium]